MPMNAGIFAGSRRPSLVFLGEQRTGINQSTFTWTNVNFGTPDTSRILLLITAQAGGGVVTSATLGGQTPTLVRASTNVATLNAENRLYKLALPTGTSGTVTFTANSSPLGGAYMLFALYNCNINQKQLGTKSGAVTAFPALTLAANDIALFCDYGSGGVTWTGVQNSADSFANGGAQPWGAGWLQASAASIYNVSTNQTTTGWPFYVVFGK